MSVSRPRPLVLAFGLGLGLAALVPTASAHRLWLLASTTVLSGENQRVSVEGAISNDLFYPNHLALPLAATTATAPSGKTLELLSPSQGRIRSSFELQLDEPGTHRLTTINDLVFVRWRQDGGMQYDRGTPAEIEARDLDGLAELGLSRWISRVETFVTAGAPTPVKPTGQGVELDFITHPNDLYTGETATFRVLRDGAPYAGAEVTVVKGNDRFRDSVDELIVTSDAEGLVRITWPAPGRFWLTTYADQYPGQFKGNALERGAAYFVTLEVLPQ